MSFPGRGRRGVNLMMGHGHPCQRPCVVSSCRSCESPVYLLLGSQVSLWLSRLDVLREDVNSEVASVVGETLWGLGFSVVTSWIWLPAV